MAPAPKLMRGFQMDVILHADDFGVTPEQSDRILTCATEGVLNSLSVFANSPRFDECVSLLDGRPSGLRVGVHLNFVEGPCCADPASIPMLVDSAGVFRLGYGALLRLSFGPEAAELRRQLALEVTAQVERALDRLPELACHLRLDGHQHTQLIPAVFGAVLETVRAHDEWHLEYLRIPAEPTRPFLVPSVLGTVRPVNWVKHELLRRLWDLDRGTLAAAGLGDAPGLSATFCGVLFSGRMDEHRVAAVWPGLVGQARRAGTDLELLFHPGRVARPEDCLNPALPGFVAFSCGEGRDVEHDALCSKTLRELVGEVA